MKKVSLIILLIFTFGKIFSQALAPLASDYSLAIDNWAIKNNVNIPVSVKPLPIVFLNDFVNSDSLFSFGSELPKEKKSWFIRKLKYENFLSVDTDNFKISVDPLFNFEYEKDFISNKTSYYNTRGIRIFGNLGNELFFESSDYENQASLPLYLKDYVNSSLIVPGQGAIRSPNFFDYAYATGMLYYRLNKHFDFAFGHGKLFIGDGYRSLLLSDNSFNYPHLKISVNFNKIQYTRIMALLMGDSVPVDPFGVRVKKLAGFNVLTFMPVNWFHISFFEGTIWQYPNTKQNINFDANYLNPIIYVNSADRDIKCKALEGISIKINSLKALQLYGQIAFDKTSTGENSGIHFAWQTGIKYFNAFFIRNLHLQAEYNTSQNGTYTDNQQIYSYTHYNQPLADPLGTNFKECIFKIHYNLKSWQLNVQINFAGYGIDSLKLPAKNTNKFIEDYSFNVPFLGLGPFTKLFYSNYSIAYLLNPKTNLLIEAGYVSRKAEIENTNHNTSFFYLSFKTSLTNLYYDF